MEETRAETMVLEALQPVESLTMDQLFERLPVLTWNQLFGAVDGLSRRGVVVLRRRGAVYELRMARRLTEAAGM